MKNLNYHINTIKLNYYKLLIISIKNPFTNKYKYPLLKLHPSNPKSNYHHYRHQIELINYTK